MTDYLIPPEHSHHFLVGLPTNPCPERDYSGRESLVQFPLGWHCQTNDAGVAGAAGGYEQNCDDFRPDRISVIREDTRNVIRLIGGIPNRKGGAVIAHPFTRPVEWGTGEGVLYEATLKFASVPESVRYFNTELRGVLNFKPKKNEPVEVFGLHIAQRDIMLAWWLNGTDGDGLEKRFEQKFDLDLARDEWHRFRVELTPLAVPDTWQVSLKIRSQRENLFEFVSTEGIHPNNVKQIRQVMLGDERRRNETGGVTYVARASVKAVL